MCTIIHRVCFVNIYKRKYRESLIRIRTNIWHLIGRLNQPAADGFLPLRAFKPSSSYSADRGRSIIQVSIWYASTRHISSAEDRITSIKHGAPRINSKMATIDECIGFALKNIGLWWRYRISQHCDEWKYIIIGRIFKSEIILIPPSSGVQISGRPWQPKCHLGDLKT